jgi:hypothetical protein
MAGSVVLMRFIGQSGVIRKTVVGNTLVGYRFRPDDTYIRVEILSPNTTIVLNPVARTANGSLPHTSARVNSFKTALWLLLWIVLYGGVLAVVWRYWHRRKTMSLS